MSEEMEQDDTELMSPIIDCDVLEAAKENIQPLAKGRRATALSAILATPHAQRENQLAATRRRLRMNVDLAIENSTPSDDQDDEEDTDADPLEAYCTYVYWVVENYPQGHSAESGLLELLEEATRVLKDHRNGEWRNDLRYLELWVLYATYVEKPTIIYKFCMVNDIGTDHALLYEEAALALERAGRKSEADETYLLGIARKAEPLERLEAKHHEFQKRMMASPSITSATTSAVVDPPAPIPASGSRRVLGDSSSRSTRTTRSSARLAAASSSTPLPAATPARPQPNGRIQVFVDTQDHAASSQANEDDAPSAWPELGTRKSRVKENTREATKAAGTTLRQSGRSRPGASSGTPKISVFRDPAPQEGDEENDPLAEEARDMPPPPTVPAKVSRSSSSRSIPVFRDDAPEKPQPKSSKSSKGIPVFRDDAPEPSEVKSSKSGKSIAVFCDEEPHSPQKARSSKSGKSIAMFRDEEPEMSSKTKKTKATKGMAVFRDDDDPKPVEPGPSVPASKTVIKPKKSGKSAIAVFCDDEAAPPAPEPTRTKAAAEKAKVITVFKDDEAGSSTILHAEQSAGFMPFKDEGEEPQAPPNAAKTKSVGLGILGVGGSATKSSTAAKMSTEAEALRKDPLKNYPDDEKPIEVV